MNVVAAVKRLELPADSYAVFGSGGLGLRGWREPHDIDLVVSPELYDQLRERGWREDMSPAGHARVHKGMYEASLQPLTMSGHVFTNDQIIARAEVFEGVPFVRLQDVLAWKRSHRRPKDQDDIKIIESYFEGIGRGV